MREIILGGSFNPIHHGHLVSARAVAEQRGFEGIALMPSGQPPHKPESAGLASAADREHMLRLAVKDDPLFRVDDMELRRDGLTYTFDTATELKRQSGKELHWLIGADMLMYLPKWHRAVELLEVVQFLIVARPGWQLDWEQLPPEFRHLRDNVIEAPLLDIRASDIRARVAAGRSVRYLTPDAVCDYIQKRRLYRTPGVA